MNAMSLFSLFSREDKTAGTVARAVQARKTVERAGDELNALLDKIDGRMEITVKAFMAETKAARRD